MEAATLIEAATLVVALCVADNVVADCVELAASVLSLWAVELATKVVAASVLALWVEAAL